ncbi:hypothetical protein Q6348_14845 [Isoptericola sp. b441]|uniref:MarR family transcriptional regulator n=1 Tax=Actinotalea lenta TaxID=3064654 RepID=A0ABT9DDU7_9CELL|nr:MULTISPECIES: hypothetical protein [unclassified Isoptericola]MDO8108473.1 hypothetical protein [Isoptericola sp. b441]MDO8119892.1 hypothetical protein [Isoptericola sp. b490]
MTDTTERSLRDPREVIREEMTMHAVIKAALADGPLTVPELASAIGRPAEEVLYWVMGMRRYGHVVEMPEADDEGYFPYALPKGA